MFRVIEFVYILSMFICVAAFSVHMTVRYKNIPSVSRLARQGSTTAFLFIVLITDLCDFLIIYSNRLNAGADVSFLYVLENILEVVLIYTVILMEKDYFRTKMPRALETLFGMICLVLIYFDGIMDWDAVKGEEKYFWLMILINAIPISALAVCTVMFRKRAEASVDYKPTSIYLIGFNVFCLFICIICTMANADRQTRHQFVENSTEIYQVIWLMFNIFIFAFVWRTINTQDQAEWKKRPSLEERIEALGEEKGLSQREREIAGLLCMGKNNKEIAQELYLSSNTVKVHLSNLYHKIGAANRVQAVSILNGDTPLDASDEDNMIL